MAVVELKAVSKTYGSVIAVADLSLRIEHGEFVALLGPSGCGKTTTLQMVAGFIPPTSGEILVDARPMSGVPPHKRNIGVVFQSYALFPHLCVLDNVGFGLKMRGVPKPDMTARVQRALDLVRLQGLDARFPRELSGGQQQRVALARALVIEPAVLLLDEPLSNLDANLREQMRFEIREIQKRIGITTIFVTHDQNEAMAAADRLVIMSKGDIRQVGSAREIYESPQDVFVAGFIGQANLLRGEVTDLDGREAKLALGDATVIARHRGDIRPREAATLALRPEDLRITDRADPSINNVAGVVARVNYLGAFVNVGVRAGARTLTITMPRGERMPAEGEAVYVSWQPTAGVLLRDTP